jgi:multiple sugar transport system substrate-binding protein
MKRTLAVILAGASLVISACGSSVASPSVAGPGASTGTNPGSSPAAASASAAATVDECAGGKDATITFWHTYNTDGPETKQFDAVVIPAFERKCPNITVDAVVQPYDGLHDQLVTAVAGGGLPDVMRMDIIWTPEFAALGALAEVDGMPGFDQIKTSVFPGPLATNAYKGKYYGVPLDTNTQTLIYNTKLVPAAPKTLDEFKAAATAMKGADQWGLGLGGAGGWNMFPWFWTAGGTVTDDAYTKASGYLDSDASIAALQWIVDLSKDGLMGPSATGGKPDSWGGFQSAKYGMISDGPWFFPIIGTAMGPNVVSTTIPTGPGGSISVIGGENLVTFKSSKNPDAAWAFSRFMLSDEAQMDMAAVGQLPVTQTAADSKAVTNVAYYAPFIEQLKTAKPRPVTPAWVKMDPILTDAFDTALRGKKTAAEALHAAAALIDPLLAQ